MKPSLAAIAIVLLLPSVCPGALFDESSPRKVKLEDIEEEHLQHERRSKTVHHSQSFPPPLNKQPAKGQPIKMYTPLTVDAATEYQKQAPTIAHHQYTTVRAKHQPQHQHQRVQPLTDQPTVPEADYQQAPAYQSETIVYLPSRARGPGSDGHDDDQQQQQQHQQPSPIFYYSHDSRHQPSSTGSGFQLQFVPISQSSGSDEHQQQQQHHQQQQQQHSTTSSYHGPQVTVPSAEESASVVSYSHGSAASSQPSQAVQYLTSNEVREPSEVQHVYSIFASDKDIEYVKPINTYGSPFSKLRNSRPSPTYGPSQQPTQVFSLQKDIEYAQGEVEEIGRKPSITYGPPGGVGETPNIEYGDPDAPFRRPSSQSNQNAYAPRRPESLPQPDEKPFAVSFPYPPSFVSITTTRPYYEKTAPTPEPSYNEVSQWQAPNVMPLHLIPPQDTKYRSYSNAITLPTPAPPTTESQPTPLIDFFHSRRAKSLLDSYIPSWLIARMQEEHARHLQQQNYVQPQPETGYNTIAYSTHFENIYPKNFKRSIKGNLAKTA